MTEEWPGYELVGEVRKCEDCGVEKDLREYDFLSGDPEPWWPPDGRSTYCKECVRTYKEKKAATATRVTKFRAERDKEAKDPLTAQLEEAKRAKLEARKVRRNELVKEWHRNNRARNAQIVQVNRFKWAPYPDLWTMIDVEEVNEKGRRTIRTERAQKPQEAVQRLLRQRIALIDRLPREYPCRTTTRAHVDNEVKGYPLLPHQKALVEEYYIKQEAWQTLREAVRAWCEVNLVRSEDGTPLIRPGKDTPDEPEDRVVPAVDVPETVLDGFEDEDEVADWER